MNKNSALVLGCTGAGILIGMAIGCYHAATGGNWGVDLSYGFSFGMIGGALVGFVLRKILEMGGGSRK